MAPFEFSLGFLPSRMQSGGSLRLLPHSKSSGKLIDDWKDTNASETATQTYKRWPALSRNKVKCSPFAPLINGGHTYA